MMSKFQSTRFRSNVQEEKIRREEAKVLGQQELASSSLDAQFQALEDVGVQAEVDARLAALKQGNAPQAIDQ